MSVKFEHLSVSDALERSLRNQPGLSARDSATVAAARVIAARIDELAENGFIDPNQKLDNVTVPTFLKYLDALGLTVKPDVKSFTKSKVAQVDMLTAFREKHSAAG